MKIFNKEKTQELINPDLTKGYLIDDEIITHVDAIAEVSHYEVVKTYANGGKDVRKIVEVEGVKAHDKRTAIKVYVPFTAQELITRDIAELKARLTATDYQAIKYAEGVMSLGEYEPIREQRKVWRAQINNLENQLTQLQ